MLCNLTPAPTSNGLSSPPVPAGFAVKQPTQQELRLRETTSIARGVRTIESAWPGQSLRQDYSSMPGRHYNRRGVDPTRNPNNRGASYLARDDGSTDQPSLSPGPGGQTSVTRGSKTANNMLARTVPLLYSLLTAGERLATQQARDQENRNAMLEKKYNKQLLKNSFRTGSSASASTTEPTGRIESPEMLDRTRGMAEASSNHPSASPRAPSQPIFVNRDWANLPEISVRVGPNLPMQYSTVDLYNLFEDYGEVESVELFENSSGTRDGNGRVKFRYNPLSFHRLI